MIAIEDYPRHTHRLIRAYMAQDYTLVQSEHKALAKMEQGMPRRIQGLTKHPTIYITTTSKPMSLVNRDPDSPIILRKGCSFSRNKTTSSRKETSRG